MGEEVYDAPIDVDAAAKQEDHVHPIPVILESQLPMGEEVNDASIAVDDADFLPEDHVHPIIDLGFINVDDTTTTTDCSHQLTLQQ